MKSLLLVLALVLAGCAASAPRQMTPQEDGTYRVLLTSSNQFLPARGQLPANSTVVFVSQGNHDVQVDGPATGSSGDAGGLKSGSTWSYRFEEPGTYELVCLFHEAVGMKAVLTVV